MNQSQYNRINELLAEHSTVSAALERAEAAIKTVQLEAAKELLPEHAQLKVKLTDLETELRKLSDANYDALFGAKTRSHQTPFGGLKYHKSSSLETEDEEKAILKIKLDCTLEADSAKAERRVPLYTTADYIRTKESLNLEALESVPAAILARWGIVRVEKDNFKVLPFDMRTDSPRKTKKSKSPEPTQQAA